MSADPYGTLVPPGEYRVTFVRREESRAFGSLRWFCWFRITEPGPYFGSPLLRFYNVPRGRFLPKSHNLAIDYINVIEQRPPARGLKPENFLKDCEIRAKVVTVTHRVTAKGRVKQPEAVHYSKIDRLIRITAGCPPCTLGSRA